MEIKDLLQNYYDNKIEEDAVIENMSSDDAKELIMELFNKGLIKDYIGVC